MWLKFLFYDDESGNSLSIFYLVDLSSRVHRDLKMDINLSFNWFEIFLLEFGKLIYNDVGIFNGILSG